MPLLPRGSLLARRLGPARSGYALVMGDYGGVPDRRHVHECGARCTSSGANPMTVRRSVVTMHSHSLAINRFPGLCDASETELIQITWAMAGRCARTRRRISRGNRVGSAYSVDSLYTSMYCSSHRRSSPRAPQDSLES